MQFFAHPTAVIDEGCSVGDGTKIWHFTHVMSGAVIGKDCVLGQNVFVDNKVMLGNNVHIQNNVSVYEGVICEDDVFLGPSVVLTNVINPRSALSRKDQFKTTLIKRGATVGANATIVCGNQIGEYAFIGAGAVITKDVLPYALITGNPGRQAGWISENGHRLTFDENQKAVCPESGQEYFLENDRVKRMR
jgi:UDP-2-acetamido-3-amino-2,3-dideoxy-glucuronate N-acetyltransferase